MHPTVTRPAKRRRQAGFSLTELLIASTAFVSIMAAAVTMLAQWQRVNGRAESDISAINQAATAIGQIADDVRMATYIYHYATISIEQSGVSVFTASTPPTENFKNIGIVTQDDDADGLPGTFFTSRGVPTSMMGVGGEGTSSVLALITDQPYGLNRPRYILYWMGPASGVLRGRTERTEGNLSVHPLYRLEASPSSAVAIASPTSWYSFKDPIKSTSATSGLYITLKAANSTLEDYWSAGVRRNSVTIGYKIKKVADIVMGPDIAGPFTLRNEHPFSNASLLSPYSAAITLTTSRVGNKGSLRSGNVDVYTLTTSAFARNIPLPQI